MIVNLQTTGWEVIYHRAHALLAAQIAGHWDFKDTKGRLYETVTAISHHDDLEKEWEEDQLSEVGAPLDFTLERATSIEQLQRLADEALYRGRWVALLISMHLCFLNQAKARDSQAMAEFLDQQRQRQQRWREELGLSQAELDSAYAFMRWCDRLSLILCMHRIPQAQRELEITKGPNGRQYSVFRRDDGRLSVTPWPFTPDEFSVNVEACHLSQLRFDTNDELNQALKQAPRDTLVWTFARLFPESAGSRLTSEATLV